MVTNFEQKTSNTRSIEKEQKIKGGCVKNCPKLRDVIYGRPSHSSASYDVCVVCVKRRTANVFQI